jgi:hypothetical protein
VESGHRWRGRKQIMSISKEHVNELDGLLDSAINTFDIPEENEGFFRTAELRQPKRLNVGPSVGLVQKTASAQVKES